VTAAAGQRPLKRLSPGQRITLARLLADMSPGTLAGAPDDQRGSRRPGTQINGQVTQLVVYGWMEEADLERIAAHDREVTGRAERRRRAQARAAGQAGKLIEAQA
jgi:hypothetical protein